MKLRVGLVAYETLLHAWVLDLPGCVAGGRDHDALNLHLPLAIAEHVAWLRGHGEDVEEPDGWEIVETAHASPNGGDACFEAEQPPPSPEELELAIRRMTFARDDLLASFAALPRPLLDWEPPATAFASFDPWAPEPRSIRGLVEHVLAFEVYYRDALRDGPSRGIAENVPDTSADRAMTVARLRSLTGDELGRTFHPIRPGIDAAESWTVRKVLRRLISHERAHTAEIMQRRTWLILGPPLVAKDASRAGG